MSDTTIIEQTAELPPECARELQIAVMGAMRLLGGDVLFVDESDAFAPESVKLARVGSSLVIVERAGDRARGRPHRFTCYEVDEAEPGWLKLDPERVVHPA